MEEEWRIIPDWPNYEVSNFGEVFSKRRNRLLRVRLNAQGYPRVYLNREDEWKTILVHRLVASVFVSGYFDGAVVNHMDGVKQNNRADNLEWTTHDDNVSHAYENGLNPGRGPAKKGLRLDEYLERYT